MSPVRMDEVFRFETSLRGAYQDLGYTPTFRASAIFFVLVDGGVNTHVSFMNYWREKNETPSVAALITLRDGDGRRVRREYVPLQAFVYQFDVRQLVGNGDRFMGSLEVEVFSTQDLKYAFPAIEVFYETPDGISFVHSNQRVFNNIEDLDRNAGTSAWQTGFDVYGDAERAGYLTVVNGPRAVESATARLEVFNATGQVLKTTVPLGDLGPYAARFVRLDEIPSIPSFLAGQAGFCKVHFDTFGVFTRIACGTLTRDRRRLAVTHSFYDCSATADYFPADGAGDQYRCFYPFSLVEGLDLDFVYYPIYTPARLTFSLDVFGAGGEVAARLDHFARFDSSGATMLRIGWRKLLEERGMAGDGRLCCVHLEGTEGRIPTRVTFGMNYHRGGLGTNISTGMAMNQGYGVRPRGYLWGPLMSRAAGRNWILVSHLSKIRGHREDAELWLTIFAGAGPIVARTYSTTSGTAVQIDADALVAGAGYAPRPNEILWYTLESRCPDYLCNELHVSPTGFVGGDHSF